MSESWVYPISSSYHAWIIETSKTKPQYSNLELGKNDIGQDGSADEYKAFTICEKGVGICTSVLENKTIACSTLACFIAELGGGFTISMKQWSSSWSHYPKPFIMMNVDHPLHAAFLVSYGAYSNLVRGLRELKPTHPKLRVADLFQLAPRHNGQISWCRHYYLRNIRPEATCCLGYTLQFDTKEWPFRIPLLPFLMCPLWTLLWKCKLTLNLFHPWVYLAIVTLTYGFQEELPVIVLHCASLVRHLCHWDMCYYPPELCLILFMSLFSLYASSKFVSYHSPNSWYKSNQTLHFWVDNTFSHSVNADVIITPYTHYTFYHYQNYPVQYTIRLEPNARAIVNNWF